MRGESVINAFYVCLLPKQKKTKNKKRKTKNEKQNKKQNKKRNKKINSVKKFDIYF
jgi:hypothetical protein